MTSTPAEQELTPEARIAALLADDEEFGADEAARAKNPGWGARLVEAGKGQPHSGDCRAEPWTCLRCQHDDYMARAAIFAAAIQPTRTEGDEGLDQESFILGWEACDRKWEGPSATGYPTDMDAAFELAALSTPQQRAEKPLWRSPETGAELIRYTPSHAPPGPPSGPLLVDPNTGQLWRFDMGGRLQKAIGRVPADELAGLASPQQGERS